MRSTPTAYSSCVFFGASSDRIVKVDVRKMVFSNVEDFSQDVRTGRLKNHAHVLGVAMVIVDKLIPGTRTFEIDSKLCFACVCRDAQAIFVAR